MQIKAGLFYFALVFGAGFILGAIRTLWIAPSIGVRTAELAEAPIMLIVSLLAARWTVMRFRVPPTASARLAMGCVALGFMLAAEFGLVRFLRGMSAKDYLAGRDPVSGTVYYLALVAFAIMPAVVGRR